MWRARSSRSISESSGVSGRFIISSAFSNASDRFFVSDESNTPLEGSALNSVIVTLSSQIAQVTPGRIQRCRMDVKLIRALAFHQYLLSLAVCPKAHGP